MGFDDRTADRQPQSQPVSLGGKKGIEQVIDDLRIDGRAGTADFDDQAFRGSPEYPDGDGPVAFARRLQGIDRIEQQVDDDLFDLDAIGVDLARDTLLSML